MWGTHQCCSLSQAAKTASAMDNAVHGAVAAGGQAGASPRGAEPVAGRGGAGAGIGNAAGGGVGGSADADAGDADASDIPGGAEGGGGAVAPMTRAAALVAVQTALNAADRPRLRRTAGSHTHHTGLVTKASAEALVVALRSPGAAALAPCGTFAVDSTCGPLRSCRVPSEPAGGTRSRPRMCVCLHGLPDIGACASPISVHDAQDRPRHKYATWQKENRQQRR